jgi:hypothetical protein
MVVEPMKRSFAVIVVAVVASMAMAGMALAEGAEEPVEQELLTPTVFVDDDGTIYIGFPDSEDFECPPEATTTLPPEAPADIDDGDAEGEEGGEEVELHEPGDCIDFLIDPDREMNHGAVVSTVAKGLHPSTLKESGYKKGEIMRLVAKTGKTPDDLVAEGADDDDDDEPKVELDKADKADKPRGKSENARTKDKPNKGKKDR